MPEIRGAATESTLRRVATLLGNGYSDPADREIRGAATEETLLRIEAAIGSGGGGGGGGGGDVSIDLGITGATVGQYPQVAAVDSDGAPTEWTAASGYTLPLMSADVRGGAKIQPNSGLEISGTDNLQVRLALESDGDVRGGLAQVTAKGHAEQVATTGKNIVHGFQAREINGITFTVNDDGTITANGTSTSEATCFTIDFTLDAGTYVMSCGSGIPSTVADAYVYSSTVSSAVMRWNNQDGNPSATLSDCTCFMSIRIKSGQTVNNLTFYPQLELGSTATEYEPYTGGLPSPRPDWEQPIEVVRGRNLLFKRLNANITDSGVVDASSQLFTVHVARVKNGETYSVITTDDSLVYAFFSTEPIIDSVSFNGSRTIASLSTKTITAPIDGYVGLRSKSNATSVQLTLGSTPQPYVPYGHVGMEVDYPNLVSSDDWQIGKNWVGGSDSARATVFIDVLPNTEYTLHYDQANVSSISVVEKISASATSAITSIVVDAGKNLYTFTTSGTTNTVVIQINKTSVSMSDIDSAEIIFVAGNVISTTTPIPLPQRGWVGSLPDGTADVLTLDGAGKCEWTLPTSEVTFDGSSDEGWNQQDVYTNNARYTFVTDVAFNKSNGGQLLCSHLPEGNAGSDSVNIDLHGSQRMIQMTVPYLTVADFKTWLSTHPVTVLYPLTTPVTEDCGYVEDWPTDIPEGATVTISELDSVGIKYFIDSGVTELAKQWYARARSEYEDRITSLEDAVAELVTGA